MEGFEPPRRFSTPTSRFSRPFPSTAWVHLQMYSRSNVSRKKERNLERNPDFLLISYSRDPLKTQGKLKNGFQNALPFSRLRSDPNLRIKYISPGSRADRIPSTNRTGRRPFKAEMPGSNPAGITIHALSSAGQSTRLRIWGAWVQIPQSVPNTGLV